MVVNSCFEDLEERMRLKRMVELVPQAETKHGKSKECKTRKEAVEYREIPDLSVMGK